MIHCSKRDAAVLVRYGHRVYSEVDEDLNPTSFFTMPEGTLSEYSINKRPRGQRRPNRGHIPSTAILKLTKATPHFVMRNTKMENVYIATRDLLAQKKYGGKIERRKLEDYLIGKLKMGATHVASTVSQLIYTKKALEEVK